MKKTGYWKGFGSALLLVAMVTALGITAPATYQRTIQVEDGISITLNGAKFTPRDVNGKEVPVFLYNGTTYAPVRAVCEAAGMEVSYNSATDTVVLTTMEQAASQKADSGSYITESRAKEIALADAGVAEADAVFLKVRLDWDDGRAEYEVEFYSGNTEYDYDIDAVTGAIRERSIETRATAQPAASSYIGVDQAKSIALKHAGLSAAEVSFTKAKLEKDDGLRKYEIEFIKGSTEYEYEIDAATGSVLEYDVERSEPAPSNDNRQPDRDDDHDDHHDDDRDDDHDDNHDDDRDDDHDDDDDDDD